MLLKLKMCENSMQIYNLRFSNLIIFSINVKNVFCKPSYCTPGGNLQQAWYRASTAEGFAVLARCWHKYGLPPARLQKVTWLEIVYRNWRGSGHLYHVSTEICTGTVLASLRSRLLADTWS